MVKGLFMEHKSITLPVLHGATVEWVKAQKEEMKARLLQEFADVDIDGYKFEYQYTYKYGFPYMTVGLKVWHDIG